MRFLIVSTEERLGGYDEFVEALCSLGVEATCVNNSKYCLLSEHRPLNRVPFPRLIGLVKRFNPDFVITDDFLYVVDMAKLVSRRVLLHMRGSLRESSWQRFMYPSLFDRMYTSYRAINGLSSVRKFDMILPNSKWLQEQVKEQFPDLLTQVLYVGIDSAKWVPGQNIPFKVKHPAVVGVTSFDIYKKISGLLKFTRAVSKMPDVSFYFAGDPRGAYFNLIKQNSPPNMFLIGRVPEGSVKRLIESGDVFVHPSGLDALPRVVKEASLLEKPIVASNIGGIPEIVINDQTGYLCDINDTDEWAAKIRFLLENPDIAQLFGKNAREFVTKTFGWRKIAENFLEVARTFQN